jgi:hypothetical protein
MKMYATYKGEEVEVVFSGYGYKVDYGVPGSPVWYEVEDPEVESVSILGVDVMFKELPKVLQETILELSYEVEWEND